MSEHYRGDVTDVATLAVLEEGTIYDRIWQPYAAQWGDEHLIVAYGHHLAGKVDMGDLVAMVSKDAGKTWSAPITIFDHREKHGSIRFAYANPVLYRRPGDDVLWCYGMRCPPHYRDSEESHLCGAYSADGGYTWQEVELTNRHHQPVITVAGIHHVPGDPDRFLLPVHSNTKRHDPRGTDSHFVLESTNLVAWNLASYIPEAPEGSDPDDVFLHEGSLAQAPGSSELEMVMRTGKRHTHGALDVPVAYRSVSADDGRTWSPPEPQALLHNTVSKAYYGYTTGGTAVYVYSAGAWRERRGLEYRTRPPGGDWSDARLFYDSDSRNSYPTLLEERPGEFLCVWDSSTDGERQRNAIRFGRLKVD